MSFTRIVVCLSVLSVVWSPAVARDRWSPEMANAWQQRTGWLVGANFTPAYAINQLEMWQADTFDSAAIDRELGWAKELGFNSMRVFLHHLLWEQDREGFKRRMNTFLTIAERHNIGIMFVLFDSVWDPEPQPGKQRDPEPGRHNSGWVQSPGARDLMNPDRHPLLGNYVRGVISHFQNDTRIHAWDLWNEPDNLNDNSYGKNKYDREPKGKVDASLKLLRQSFEWARESEPTQPITSGVWIGTWDSPNALSPTERLQLEESDVITFHSYGKPEDVLRAIRNLRRYGRPLLCTEYMARPQESRFDPILMQFRREQVAAYNWGFVAGKTNTIYPWDSWQTPYDSEPTEWFHDILRADGTPYREDEVDYIRRVIRQ